MTDAEQIEYIAKVPPAARGIESRRLRTIARARGLPWLVQLADDLELSYLCHMFETGRLHAVLDARAACGAHGIAVTVTRPAL
jgi:hypothetical protein